MSQKASNINISFVSDHFFQIILPHVDNHSPRFLNVITKVHYVIVIEIVNVLAPSFGLILFFIV